MSGCRTTPFLEKLEQRAGEEGKKEKEKNEEALAKCNRTQTAILRFESPFFPFLLDKTCTGQKTALLQYSVSPSLVKQLRNIEETNMLFKKTLCQ